MLTVIALGLAVWLNADRAVLRASRRVAQKVLSYAAELEGHQLWVALPFPAYQPDPKRYLEDWGARPRRWVRALGGEDSTLLLENGDVIDALGCEWYVYADSDGKALRFAVSSRDGELDLPAGIDSESVCPSDVLIGDAHPPDGPSDGGSK